MQYGQDIIEQLYKVAQVIRISGVVLIAFLAGAELFIISNTIRLTVFARRREIQIMKYVGATNGFIRWPFLFEGMIIGLIGSGIASFILWEGYKLAINEMTGRACIIPYHSSLAIHDVYHLDHFGHWYNYRHTGQCNFTS